MITSEQETNKKKKQCKCICCKSPAITLIKDLNIGYCSKCMKKREEFVNKVTGTVNIGNPKTIKYLILSPIEKSRQIRIKKILYHFIDHHFSLISFYYGNNKNLKEPYHNQYFINKCYEVKKSVTLDIINIINDIEFKTSSTLNLYKNIIINFYNKYIHNLKKMYAKDYDINLNTINKKRTRKK